MDESLKVSDYNLSLIIVNNYIRYSSSLKKFQNNDFFTFFSLIHEIIAT